jgi:hypothetical protein
MIRSWRDAPTGILTRWAGLIGLFFLLGCASSLPSSNSSPNSQSISPSTEKPLIAVMAPFGKRIPLSIELPKGYEINGELGGTFEVFHIWKTKPVSLEKDANLGIYVGPYALPHCADADGKRRAQTPQRAPRAGFHWRVCTTTQPGLKAREAFQQATPRFVLHVFILGQNRTEMDNLQRIAETLRGR